MGWAPGGPHPHPEGLEGVSALHQLLADHAEGPAEVLIGIEIDRGLLVGSLVAAGYQVYAVNPESWTATGTGTPCRARSPTRGTPRSWLTWCAPTGTITGPSPVTATWPRRSRSNARAHQSLIWTRQRQVNQLRSTLREYYPGALAAFRDRPRASRRGRGAWDV